MVSKQQAKQAKAKAKAAEEKTAKSKDKKKAPPAPPAPSPAKKQAPKKKADSPPKVDAKRKAPATDDKKADKAGDKKVKEEPQMVKVITKGGAAVDQYVPNKDGFRVFQDGGKSYAATLNQSNLDANNNKFYIIQILQQ